MSSVSLGIGPIDYEDTGPHDGRPVVFVHGYWMGPGLWAPLAQRLAASGLRCIAPAWPLGAHATAMTNRAAVTMPGIAAAVGELLTALDLEDVVLVGNDTGGLIAQIAATADPSRLGALVLTSCDAFEHFPPPAIRPLILASRSSATFRIALQPMRTRFARQRGFGALAHTDIDSLVADWLAPALADGEIAEDLRHFTASLRQQISMDVAARLPELAIPTLVAWSADDAFFPIEDGRRLVATIPGARLEIIDAARTFSMLDQPQALAELILSFTGVMTAAHASGGGMPETT